MSPSGNGRNIDPEIGALSGEAAGQQTPRPRQGTQGSAPFEVWRKDPSSPTATAEPTYYDRPVIKEPVWIWAVPAYFYAGGVAGAAAVLGAAAQLSGGGRMRGLVHRCRWIAAAGTVTGTGLLIHDLGRLERFLNMLRVFRKSSPLSIGSWVLAAAGPLTTGSAVLGGAGGVLGRAGDWAGAAAGVVGMPLAGYTAVLVSTTAVPVWQESRRSLPALFVASALAGAASLLELLDLGDGERRVVHRLGIAAKVAELASMEAVRSEASRVEEVGRALKEGLAGAVLNAARACTGASLALSLIPMRARWKRAAVGVLGSAGAIGYKFGVFYAGQASARNPRATFRQQRAGQDAAEVARSRPGSVDDHP